MRSRASDGFVLSNQAALRAKKPPSLAGCWLTDRSQLEAGSQREFVQADTLDGGLHNRQATVLGREDVNLSPGELSY